MLLRYCSARSTSYFRKAKDLPVDNPTLSKVLKLQMPMQVMSDYQSKQKNPVLMRTGLGFKT